MDVICRVFLSRDERFGRLFHARAAQFAEDVRGQLSVVSCIESKVFLPTSIFVATDKSQLTTDIPLRLLRLGGTHAGTDDFKSTAKGREVAQ